MTHKEFYERMIKCSQTKREGENIPDPEFAHVAADALMCQALTDLGYGKGLKVFRDMYKWYA